MRHVFPAALLAVALGAAGARAALTTNSMDAVREEVSARAAALTGNLDAAQKKLKKVYTAVLKELDRRSASRSTDAGRIRSIGVSNFQRAHLEHLIDQCEVVPAVNQIEIHPYLVQTEVRQADSDHGIVTEAWSPLAQGTLRDDPLLEEIAAKHGRSIADIALAWNLALGNVVLTRSSNPERIRSNFTVTEIELDDDEITRISQLDRGGRVGPHPETFSRA